MVPWMRGIAIEYDFYSENKDIQHLHFFKPKNCSVEQANATISTGY